LHSRYKIIIFQDGVKFRGSYLAIWRLEKRLGNKPRGHSGKRFQQRSLRPGEAIGLAIDKHISKDFRTPYIRQKVRRTTLEHFLKTDAGDRDWGEPFSFRSKSA
jgi:hypothetical protein